MIDQAFILAAGLGTRLRPYTDNLPKPLIEVRGQSMLMRSLDQLRDAGVEHCVINTHYKAEKIEHAVQSLTTPAITLSHEGELLDTGGGIKRMIAHFNDQPFYVLSGDSYCENNPLPALQSAWDADKMDILLLLQPVQSMHLTQGVGDYTIAPDGRLTRSLDQSGTHMFTSVRINHPRIFAQTPDHAFSYRDLMDAAQAQGRLYGIEYDGQWHHISTPQDLERVNQATPKDSTHG